MYMQGTLFTRTLTQLQGEEQLACNVGQGCGERLVDFLGHCLKL